MSHTRYVVRNSQTGKFIGTKRFGFRTGTTVGITDFEHARIFTRECDAKKAREDDDWEAVGVLVVPHWNPQGEIIDP